MPEYQLEQIGVQEEERDYRKRETRRRDSEDVGGFAQPDIPKVRNGQHPGNVIPCGKVKSIMV